MPQKPKIPTVRLRRLAAELRSLRAAAGLTRDEVSERTGINATTLYRVETAKTNPQKRTLIALLDLYEADPGLRAEVASMAERATEQGWLRPYHSELPQEYTAYISFENEAWEVRNYESLFVPGLIQTEQYARAVIAGTLPLASPVEVDQRVQARMDRQAVLTKESPLRLRAVIDEAVLHRAVGGQDVMRAQMRHLLQVMDLPNVSVQAIPFSAGAHPGMPGSFVLMAFADAEEPEIVYLDSMAGDLFLEAPVEMRRYNTIFHDVMSQALSPTATAELITKLIRTTV
ncbi:helix-turn-helix domain-containing protein [Streptomyces harbinensis]|uniref:Helix-turn-helix domain-containing protein n=1 Tax=Streptomyces harbinensis TaxID=1176198 RepID=A0A1I6TZU2_9ACTN|nr:helix-turn-helix transcriptional regulator [Streptomyces harbinensis]SFS94664.1 Helix-turn-helix domain-containing protein [Streptomyces harbinensis]